MTVKDRLAALLVAVLWGVNFLAIDLGLQDTPPLVLVALRFVFVAFPLILFVQKPPVSWKVLIGIGLFQSAGQFGCLFTAMAMGLPTALAPVVLQIQMVFTILFAAILLGERPTRTQLVGAGIGVAGIVVVAVGRLQDAPGFVALLPLLVCVAGGLSWGIGNVIARSAPAGGGLGIVVWSATVVPLPMLALSLLLDGPAVIGEAFTSLGWQTAVAVAYTAIAASLVGYSIWNRLLGKYPAAAVAPFTLLVPPVGILAAVLVLGEEPNALELIGSAVLVAGVAWSTLGGRLLARRAAASAPVASKEPTLVE
ncbi:EamA family transporter [Agromyces seonyuensis]|uniref:EamA family transporter n=1 Tax=Agromyces seonyuensis TaxID=2662446 RepID=UPI003014F4C8